MSNPHASNSETTTPMSFKPMGFTDILDTTFSFYRDHFRLFVGISAVYAFWYLFFHITFPSTHWLIDWCVLVVDALFYGWLVCASMQIYLGKRTTPGAAFRQVAHRLLSYLGSFLLWLLIVGLLAITIVGIPFAIYFATRWGFYSQAVLIEGASATNALRRSGELVKGTWWYVFGIMLAILLLALMIELILVTLLMFVSVLSGVAGEVDFAEMIRQILRIMGHSTEEADFLLVAITAVVDAFTAPILPIGITLFYFDRRIRKEGFDIEMRVTKEVL